MTKLKLGISPCPNDTFIFDALVHQKIDTKGYEFEVEYLDVEELNQRAGKMHFDLCKLSYAAILKNLEYYQLLRSGGALGQGVGPLLIAKKKLNQSEIVQGKIAIPGLQTTANLLLSLAYPNVSEKVEMNFAEIEHAVNSGEVTAGLIIHENRFTYQDKGLVKIRDLGEYWEELTHSLIPLGGIVVRRDFDAKMKKELEQLLRESVLYAFDHPESSKDYVQSHAQEMETDVIRKHINLYVNQYSIDLGAKGIEAIKTLAGKSNFVSQEYINQIFIEQ